VSRLKLGVVGAGAWGTNHVRTAAGLAEAELAAVCDTDPKVRERLLRDVPLRRTGRLEEIGPLVVYLASPASDYMTGQTVFLDGGHTAG